LGVLKKLAEERYLIPGSARRDIGNRHKILMIKKDKTPVLKSSIEPDVINSGSFPLIIRDEQRWPGGSYQHKEKEMIQPVLIKCNS